MVFPLTRSQLVEANILLLRSHSLPLDIYLDFRDPFWDWEEDTHKFGLSEMSAVIRTLLPHVSRWRKLVLLTDTWIPIFSLLLTTSCAAESAPMLKSITLSRCNAYFAAKGATFKPRSLRAPIKLFGGIPLPQLSRVSLVGVHVDWSHSHLVDLLELELKYHASDVMPSLDEFRGIVSACPRLNKLIIIGWGPQLPQKTGNVSGTRSPRGDLDDRCDDDATLITLAHLTNFSFGFVDTAYAVDLLSLLHLPALQELELEDVSLTTLDLFEEEERDSSNVLDYLSGRQPSSGGGGIITRMTNGTSNNIKIPLISQITTLELRGLCAGQDAFDAFFGCAVELERLSLIETGSEAVLALSPSSRLSLEGDTSASESLSPPQPRAVCPALGVLCCRGLDHEVVVGVIAARGGSHRSSALRVLTLEANTADSVAELTGEQMDILRDAGVVDFSVYTVDGTLCQGFGCE
ncbi:hypothetical protein AX17_005874 [Amanita inopinata Kibby_2008]|nr:hypothetical protein AX17_005874 [Amanita inopinata Kibby_2008]